MSGAQKGIGSNTRGAKHNKTQAKEEIETIDIIKKHLTMHGGFHPKSSTLRLYTKRKEGGRGLASIRATVQDETSKNTGVSQEDGPK